ncbi:MAG: trypsin-like peptidase domain-containing protein [Myxococcota bacterium]|jgi:S1-C subfamily serine protease|nr:trypsin-like peptidase domain-containing protein [Myxococcota bacterium]
MHRSTPWILALSLAACTHAGPNATINPAAQQSSQWEQTVDRVAKGVVQLRVTVPRDYDTEFAGAYGGTGFIVDAERGIILTNRHLVQPGPVVAEAVFLNHEEVPLRAIYRDPVHDFGFFQYDPSQVRFAEIETIPLAPEAARVGIDIRVIGNDAGEKLSILMGTLARLDRDAPIYDTLSYNDFNTFYYQAASGTSGGSSGSPVIDIEGRAVALNAGGAFFAESSFFLPLHRVVRALELIQAGQEVSRGSIQTIFRYRPFDELRRLGLPLELEKRIREQRSSQVGMLVVDELVQNGPGWDKLQPGDILLDIDGQDMADFYALDGLLDASVGKELTLNVIRGGEPKGLNVPVIDLHAITPREYIEVGGGIIHALSYQQARNYRYPVEGLYVAAPGYMLGSAGVPWGAVLRAIDGQPVRSLDELWSAIAERKDRDRMQLRYSLGFDYEQEYVAVAYLDRRWFPTRRCTLREREGIWPCIDAPPVNEAWTPKAASVSMGSESAEGAEKLANSLCIVEYHIPVAVEGIYAAHYTGTGTILDTQRGLVVTDRDTVPVLLGDLELVFGGSLRIPGKVEYIHPIHNFAIVSYDPALIGDTDVKAVELDASPLKTRDKLWLVGRDRDYNLSATEAKVERIAPLKTYSAWEPAYRQINLDAVELGASTATTLGGVLANDDGKVRALWLSYGWSETGPLFRGISVSHVQRVLQPMLEGRSPDYRSLGVELDTVKLADASEYGVSEQRLRELEKLSPDRRQVLMVARTFSGFPSSELLQGGDLVLAIEQQPVVLFEDVELASQREQVRLTVLRDGAELSVSVPTVVLDGQGTERVLNWAGMTIHEPHLAIIAQRSALPRGAYIASAAPGSPAAHYGVSPLQIITEVDGVATPDLDALVAIIRQHADNQSVRLKVVDLDGLEKMLTFKTEREFWPTAELRFTAGAWQRSDW